MTDSERIAELERRVAELEKRPPQQLHYHYYPALPAVAPLQVAPAWPQPQPRNPSLPWQPTTQPYWCEPYRVTCGADGTTVYNFDTTSGAPITIPSLDLK